MRVGELAVGARRLDNVTAGLSQAGDLWRGNVSADQLDGYVEYRPARRGGAGAGRVFARLARLALPKGEVEKVESLLDDAMTSIPALDIVVDDFELRGKRLGRLEIEATNRGAATRDAAREWQLAKLNLTMPEAQFAATGTWGGGAGAAAAAPRRAAMNFTLALDDSGALLERLGMGRVIRGGKGSLTGEVSWPGSPLSPDYAKMTGNGRGGDRLGPVPEGRARARRACSACSACNRCRVVCRSTSAICSPRASPSTTSSATSGSATARRRPTTCACAALPRRC